MIASVNPATGKLTQTFDALTPTQLDEKLAHAQTSFISYRKTSFEQRRSWMHRAAQILDDTREAFARAMTSEVGKTLQSSRDEIAKCARGCRYYADNAERFLADTVIPTDAESSYVRYQPLGPILAIMPWNFPFWQVIRFAAPALMAGNVGLLKHAESVPQCALALEGVFTQAGFPSGVFQTLIIETDTVEAMIADPRIAAVILTGSERAGRAVASASGRALKRVVLELGGSDPFLVLPSADIGKAVQVGVQARVQNNGQSCIAAKRFILHEVIADEFTSRFTEAMKALVVGDPLHPETQVGPMHAERLRTGLDSQVQATVSAGARVLTGGNCLDRPGFYYAPTVLTDIPQDSPAYREELFGPVALLFRVPDIDTAIALANDTPFGLGASVWTRDLSEQARCIDEIEAGMVFINSMVVSDPPLPFGGIKNSGYGRELADVGMREFMNTKAVFISAKTPVEA